jgi:HSP20 family protein
MWLASGRSSRTSSGDLHMARFFAPAITFGQGSARLPAIDPFRMLQQGMDNLIADVARTVGPAESAGAGAGVGALLPAPRINVEETDKELRVTAELPGVSEKDVRITLEDDVLVLSGEKRQEHEVDEGDMRVVERAFGQFRRALQLPFLPDPDKVTARYRDGILTVEIPKEEEQRSRSRQIEVRRDEGGAAGSESTGGAGSGAEGSGTEGGSSRRESATAPAA